MIENQAYFGFALQSMKSKPIANQFPWALTPFMQHAEVAVENYSSLSTARLGCFLQREIMTCFFCLQTK